MIRSSTSRHRRLAFAAAGVVLPAVAFLRGNYLLGPEFGVTCVAITLGLLWLFARALRPDGRRSRVRVAIAAVWSLAVGYVMSFPATINPEVQIFVDREALDRAARAELAAVFAADPAYRDLSATSEHRKIVIITVRGSLATRPDLDRLRSRIVGECPAAGRCGLYWDVLLRDPGQRVEKSDRDLESPPRADLPQGAARAPGPLAP